VFHVGSTSSRGPATDQGRYTDAERSAKRDRHTDTDRSEEHDLYTDGGRSREGTRLAKTPDGRRVEVSREIDAPAETVWSLFTDTDYWPDWGPTIGAVELDDSDATRIVQGTTGRVRVAGLWLPFSITTCADYRWTWSVARIPATGHRVEPLDDDRCRAVFELTPLAAGYAPVCRTALRRLDRLSESVAD
jgi:hypothetical protein